MKVYFSSMKLQFIGHEKVEMNKVIFIHDGISKDI